MGPMAMPGSERGREIPGAVMPRKPPPADPGPHARDEQGDPEGKKKQGAEQDHPGGENDHLRGDLVERVLHPLMGSNIPARL